MTPFPDFPSFPEGVAGEDGWHSRPCPRCGRVTQPYDDDPWPQGHEWTSAYECTCGAIWTHGWEYPSGLPIKEGGE